MKITGSHKGILQKRPGCNSFQMMALINRSYCLMLHLWLLNLNWYLVKFSQYSRGHPSAATQVIMRLLSWNCRRMGQPLTIQLLSKLTRTHSPNILFLMETKTNAKKLDSQLESHFDVWDYILPINKEVGLCLAWCNLLSINIIAKDSHYFCVKCLK